MATAVTLDWSDPAFLADPYPSYHRLRDTDPVHWHESGFWLVTRYSDAVAMLRDPRFLRPRAQVVEDPETPVDGSQLSPRQFLQAYGILWRNPPDHTRLRRLLTKAFTPSVVDGLRPPIQAIVERILDDCEDRG
ncbi:MAG: cytochrome P450, partial [Gaiellaceae bacterium]